MALQVGYNRESEGTNKKWSYKNSEEVTSFSYDVEQSRKQRSDRDKLLENSTGWITPQEYYSNTATGDTTLNVSETKQVNAGGAASSPKPVYFWVEDLKNWACYSLAWSYTYSRRNVFILKVWNGKDNWARLRYWNQNTYVVNDEDDSTGFGNLQNYFLSFLNTLLQVRGISNAMKTTGSSSIAGVTVNSLDPLKATYNFDGSWYLQVVNAMRLKRHTYYGINSSRNFQTLTIGNTNVYTNGNANVGHYAQTNFRGAVTIGCPAVWRLPSGEIALCTYMEWNVDNGKAYYYKKRGYCSQASNLPADYGFKKYYSKSICTETDNDMWTILDPESQAESENAINGICRQFFGPGTNKTIENDWLNINPITIAKEEYSNASGIKGSMLNSELVFEQHNINKENSLNCSFQINRPIVTTTERPNQDYAKKW